MKIGDEIWAERFNRTPPGNNQDQAHAIAVDDSYNVYVTGQSVGAGSNWDYVTIKYSQPLVFDCIELEANIGDPCDDQDEATENDIVDEDCECAGTPIATSVETIDDASEFNVFPNPNLGNCTIALGKIYSEVEIRVMNYLGMEVERNTHFNENQIELNLNYPAGIYFIDVITDSRTTLKVLKN